MPKHDNRGAAVATMGAKIGNDHKQTAGLTGRFDKQTGVTVSDNQIEPRYKPRRPTSYLTE
jgi:hypothetical protein